MVHETGNRILNSIERKFGGLALPQILRWIAGFQLMSWMLSLFSPDFLAWIHFDRAAILDGQAWRAFTWVFFPVSPNASPLSIIIVVISAMFMFFINDSLERQWDSFRLNAYVVSTILLLALAGFVPGTEGGSLNFVFFSSVFFAFATLFPDHIIHLLAVIPIKAKWLGWAGLAVLIGLTLKSPSAMGPLVVIGMIPYLLVFVPGFLTSFRQQGEAAVRRHRFQEQSKGGHEPFHRCESCGATDESHPQLEFRVSRDGHEYCSNCRTPKEEASS